LPNSSTNDASRATALTDGAALPPFPFKPVLLVDGDIVAYRCAAACEKMYYACDMSGTISYHDNYRDAKKRYDNVLTDPEIEWIWSRKELQPVENALNNTNTTMSAIAKRFDSAAVQTYISGERNFRDTVWQTKKYKGNRDQPKPKHLEAVRQYLVSRWDAVVSQNQEADDDIGIASDTGTVVVSTDKDLDQIPGWHYNWVSGEVYYVKPEDAETFFWEQVISGDPTDNIPGLPGYGPVKARQYVEAVNNGLYADAVYELYRKEGFDYGYFHEQRTLLYILRSPR